MSVSPGFSAFAEGEADLISRTCALRTVRVDGIRDRICRPGECGTLRSTAKMFKFLSKKIGNLSRSSPQALGKGQAVGAILQLSILILDSYYYREHIIVYIYSLN